MRTELERIQLIEKYLLKTLTAEEKVIFQKEMKENANFQKEIDAQKVLMEGVKKLAFKDTATKSYKKYNGLKNLWKWGIGGALSILVLAVAIPLAFNAELGFTEGDNDKAIADISNETNFGALADQSYFISSEKDTIIETAEGIVFAIPANAFTDEDGNVVKGSVKIMVKEAITPDQIMASGLSTTSNGKQLETGGMFFIYAFSDGQKLSLSKEIIAEVPTYEIKEGMQLFDGERMADGQINWVNPTPLENYLNPVNILSLNFYPPGYDDMLAEFGHDGESKAWKDSVYYSFAEAGGFVMFSDDETVIEVVSEADGDSADSMVDVLLSEGDRLDEAESNLADEPAINPIKIQAIWDKKFNNTNLATKEFEERLQAIFTSCSHAVFELYVNNLDKELWVVDSLAADIVPVHLKSKFIDFKNRKDGKVKAEDKVLKRLSKYYVRKQKKHLEAVQKLQREYFKEQEKAATKFAKVSVKKEKKEFKRKSENLSKEFKKNLTEVNKQLGVKLVRYKLRIGTLGAKNVDRYVKDVVIPTYNATVARQSTSIKYNGKTAQIVYTPYFASVENKEQYDRMYCYLLSDELYSFQRMKDTVGGFTEKLNGFLKYNMAIVAYKGDSCFLYKKQALKAGEREDAKLTYVKKKRLKTELSLLGRNGTKLFKKDIMNDLKFEKLKVKEQARKIAATQMRNFRNQLEKMIFPCDNVDECYWEIYLENVLAGTVRSAMDNLQTTAFVVDSIEYRPFKYDDIVLGVKNYDGRELTHNEKAPCGSKLILIVGQKSTSN